MTTPAKQDAELTRLETAAERLRVRLGAYEAAQDDLRQRRELASGDRALTARIDALLARTNSITTMVNAVYSALRSVNAGLASAGEWWRGVWGLGGLGFPFIPIGIALGVIATASAAITKWLVDYNTVRARLDFIDKQVESGASLDNAQKAASGISAGGSIARVGGALAIAAVIYAGAKAVEAVK